MKRQRRWVEGAWMGSHVDHVVESENTVGLHHPVHPVGHPVGPFSHAHGIGSRQGICAVRLTNLVRSISHQHQAKFLDGLHKRGDDILEEASQ